MRLVVTDGVVWSVDWSVSLSVTVISTITSPSKTAELIEMLFWLCIQVGPTNHILDGFQIPLWEGLILRGRKGGPL